MLKNRGDDQMGYSFTERNEAETVFFSKGRYVDVPREYVGIDSLRERLSKVLLNHLIKELPSLREEMGTKLQGTVDDMEKLGERRTTINEQRMMLMKVSMRIHDILKSAVKGYYENTSSVRSTWKLQLMLLRISVGFVLLYNTSILTSPMT
jgi:hypothetical protein